MDEINWFIVAPLAFIQFSLLIIGLMDLRKVHATKGPKWLWALIIIFINIIGPILYFFIGRKPKSY